ncbi:MAG: tetratricopeptide repeat protein [Gemmatimonadota bacterium]|nr:tetratricopeptide repeat protein [Gemmatimonadota bacterium]
MLRGDFSRANELLSQALALREREFGPKHPLVLQSVHDLANMWIARGELARAEPFLRRSLELVESSLGSDHPSVPVFLSNLAQLQLKRGALSLAAPLLTRLYTIRRAMPGDRLELSNVGESLGTVRQALGELEEAERLRREVLSIRVSALGETHTGIGKALEALAETRAARGDREESQLLMTRALRLWQERGDAGRVAVAQGKLMEYQLGLHVAPPALELEPQAPAIQEKPIAPAVSIAPLVLLPSEERLPPPSQQPVHDAPRAATPPRFLPAPQRPPPGMETPAFGVEAIGMVAEPERQPARTAQTTTSIAELLAPVRASLEASPVRGKTLAFTTAVVARVRKSATTLAALRPRERTAPTLVPKTRVMPNDAIVPIAERPSLVKPDEIDPNEDFFRARFLSWKTAQVALVVLSIAATVAFAALSISDQKGGAVSPPRTRPVANVPPAAAPATIAVTPQTPSTSIVDSSSGVLKTTPAASEPAPGARVPSSTPPPRTSAAPAPTPQVTAPRTSNGQTAAAAQPSRQRAKNKPSQTPTRTSRPTPVVEDSLRAPPPPMVIPSLDSLVRVKPPESDSQSVNRSP